MVCGLWASGGRRQRNYSSSGEIEVTSTSALFLCYLLSHLYGVVSLMMHVDYVLYDPFD
jgi:hypothetical protein